MSKLTYALLSIWLGVFAYYIGVRDGREQGKFVITCHKAFGGE